VTFWALSKENILERDTDEIQGIYMLLETKLPKIIEKFLVQSVRFEVIGDIWLLPSHIRTLIHDAIEKTAD
jgi:undecaprenyl diphosphate synthase